MHKGGHQQRGHHAEKDVFDVGHASTAFLVAGSSPRIASGQQHIAPEGGAGREGVGPEAARRPEQILRERKAQHADVEIPHIPRRARLRFRIDQPSNGAVGEPYHHAAPDQVGEDVPEGAVERQQRHAERRRKPRPAAAEGAFLRGGERGLQNAQEDEAGHPAELRHIKRPAAWYRTAADTASSRAHRGQSSRRSTAAENTPACGFSGRRCPKAARRRTWSAVAAGSQSAPCASSLSPSCVSSRFICRSRKHRTVTHTPSKNAKSPMTMYPKAAPP